MSLDARYLLVYESLPYTKPTPMEKDIAYLENKYGGRVVNIGSGTFFWDKPKHTLLPDEIKNLLADQILEKLDCELWRIVK